MSDNEKNAPDNPSESHPHHNTELRAARLTVAFIESGLTLGQFSEKCSVEKDTADRWLKGKNIIPASRELIIAKALGRQDHFLSMTHPDKSSGLMIKMSKPLLSMADQMTRKELKQWLILGYDLLSEKISEDSDNE